MIKYTIDRFELFYFSMKIINIILLTSGGTRGHAYHNLAMPDYLKSKDIVDEVLYVGVERRLDEQIIDKTVIPFKSITATPFTIFYL